MKIIIKILCVLLRIPAQIKGMKFGKDSFIGPGYEYIFVKFKNISIGNNVMIGGHAWLHSEDSGRIIIKDNTQIGKNVVISSKKSITIGSNCLFSYRVSLLDYNHEFRNKEIAPINDVLTEGKAIVIEDDCFIGANSFILQGVKLGKHCVVGASSVVTKSFPAYSIVAGIPAKIIRKIT